jgi:hypothetical protein
LASWVERRFVRRIYELKSGWAADVRSIIERASHSRSIEKLDEDVGVKTDEFAG